VIVINTGGVAEAERPQQPGSLVPSG